MDSTATAKAIRTAQRLKSSLVLQSPPTRTNISSVLTALAIAINITTSQTTTTGFAPI
ncbi:hypothetical protein [Chamaesiphon sp. VAR_48_metabat_403]|uniref:hypothetical protein n=1 Tax=Chamaesiphon sp. VAR_48_metabat_403 TaxID=2964700 RepID=UPI00286E329F|nr:hypothetical protein [Chamaesiphon sp. VAR_48_metabat_403]